MLLDELHIDQNNVAFVPSLGVTFELNETAKEVIEGIREGKSKDEIVQEIAHRYGVPWQEVYIDIEDFMLKLKLYGLLA